jgi:alpha-beta hydrolase superfamily lysophospholipase
MTEALPFYLGHGPDAALCLYHEPPGDAPPGTGVVLVPPFGWDEVASYRIRRAWADELAAAGHPAVRLDLPGTGDAGGGPRDPARVDAWLAAIGEAAAWLRGRSACPRVALLGLGLGGLLACAAAARGAPAEDLALWGAPARGRSALRLLRALGRLEAAEFPVPVSEEAEGPEPGELEAGGFVLSAETVADVEALDVDALALARPGRRALLLGRDGLPPEPDLRERLDRCGVEVTTGPGEGWGDMTPAEPQEARIPRAVFTAMAQWLDHGPTGDTSAPAAPAVAIELPVGGEVRELPFTLTRPYGHLFGVLAEPLDGPAEVVAVLLNAGAVRRTGPNRMWVELARGWAARGVKTLRLDLEAIGDADGDAARYADVGEMYEPHLVDETAAAMEAVAAGHPGARFLLVGLCSGAYWAFHAALRLPHVTGAIMLNPRQLFYDPAIDVRREAQRAGRGVVSARRWRNLLRGRVRPAVVLRLLRSSVVSMGRTRRHRRALIGTMRRLEQALDQLRDLERSALIVFSEGEPLLEEMRDAGLTDELERWPNLQLEVIRGPGHTFRPVWAQRRVRARLDRALDEALAAPVAPEPVRLPRPDHRPPG